MKYEYWLAAILPLSDHKKIMLRKEFLLAEELFNIEEKEYKKFSFLTVEDIAVICNSKKTWSMDQEYQELKNKEIRMITFYDKDYPARLKYIAQPPYALFVKGNMPDADRPAIAMVGARRCTPYGEKCAIEFATKLAGAGASIISGLALGIDGISQRAALNENGKTYAVLGSGVDVCYPRNHFGLYMDILEHGGGIISEQLPKAKPEPWNFPKRNRIISGLSDVVLIMEAKEKSGSLITADFAMEQGKDVYALPGPVTSVLSRGCNKLIDQGAGILLSPQELVEELSSFGGICLEDCKKKQSRKEIMLESTEKLVYSCLDFDSKNLDTIVKETKMPPLEVINVLILLELRGLIKEISKNNYVKI